VNAGNSILQEHLIELARRYPIVIADDLAWVKVRYVELPEEYNLKWMSILVEIPYDYPMASPGRSSRLFIPEVIRQRGRTPSNFHPSSTPSAGGKGWAWICFEDIAWDPRRDNLITIVEMVHTILTKYRPRKNDNP